MIQDGDGIMNGVTAIFGGQVGAIGNYLSVDVNVSLFNFFEFHFPFIGALALFLVNRNGKKDRTMQGFIAVGASLAFLAAFVILNNLG